MSDVNKRTGVQFMPTELFTLARLADSLESAMSALHSLEHHESLIPLKQEIQRTLPSVIEMERAAVQAEKMRDGRNI